MGHFGDASLFHHHPKGGWIGEERETGMLEKLRRLRAFPISEIMLMSFNCVRWVTAADEPSWCRSNWISKPLVLGLRTSPEDDQPLHRSLKRQRGVYLEAEVTAPLLKHNIFLWQRNLVNGLILSNSAWIFKSGEWKWLIGELPDTVCRLFYNVNLICQLHFQWKEAGRTWGRDRVMMREKKKVEGWMKGMVSFHIMLAVWTRDKKSAIA